MCHAVRRELKVRVEGQLVFNGSAPMLKAALAGFGLAYLPEDLVQADLAKGRLIRVLTETRVGQFQSGAIGRSPTLTVTNREGSSWRAGSGNMPAPGLVPDVLARRLW